MANPPFADATGRLVRFVPASPERDELLLLVRAGIPFARQHHTGGHPGFLRSYITGIVARMKPPVTFNQLLHELTLDEKKRNSSDTGKSLPPIIYVNWVWEVVTYDHPRRGEVQTTFGNIRNILSKAKKDNSQVPPPDETSLIRSVQKHAHAARQTKKDKTT